MDFNKLIDERYSVRSFKNEHLKQEVIDKILEAGHKAPTGCNYQPQRIDGEESAIVQSSYFIKEKNSYSKTYQDYLLRKNEAGEWKILGFEKVEGDTSNGK